MANTVKDILTQSRLVASTELGATYQRLMFVFDLSKLNTYAAKLAFGFRSLSAVPNETVTKSFTQDQEFELILVDTIANTSNDTDREESLDVMYDKQDEIMKQMILTKINLSGVVLNVSQPSISEPEFFDDNKIVALRTQYTVKYRSLLT